MGTCVARSRSDRDGLLSNRDRQLVEDGTIANYAEAARTSISTLTMSAATTVEEDDVRQFQAIAAIRDFVDY